MLEDYDILNLTDSTLLKCFPSINSSSDVNYSFLLTHFLYYWLVHFALHTIRNLAETLLILAKHTGISTYIRINCVLDHITLVQSMHGRLFVAGHWLVFCVFTFFHLLTRELDHLQWKHEQIIDCRNLIFTLILVIVNKTDYVFIHTCIISSLSQSFKLVHFFNPMIT